MKGLSLGAWRAFKKDGQLGTYRARKAWLGAYAAAVGDTLLTEAGLFPEAFFTRRRKGLWAATYENALEYGGIFYELSTRLGRVSEPVGKDLRLGFAEWVELLHQIKHEFDLWARDAATILRLREIGMEPPGLENVVAFHH